MYNSPSGGRRNDTHPAAVPVFGTLSHVQLAAGAGIGAFLATVPAVREYLPGADTDAEPDAE